MKIACILAAGFEDSELRVPTDRLVAAGHQVVVIGARRGDELAGKKGKERVKVDRSIDEVRADDFDALLIPGGHSPDVLRADDRFVNFVAAFERAKKPIAAVCHGPQLLLTAHLVRGRRLTAWKTVQEDLRQAGAVVLDREAVIDDNWVTSRRPEDLESFSQAFLGMLGSFPAAHP